MYIFSCPLLRYCKIILLGSHGFPPHGIPPKQNSSHVVDATPPIQDFYQPGILPEYSSHTRFLPEYSSHSGFLSCKISPAQFSSHTGSLPNGITPTVFLPYEIPPRVFLPNGIPPMVFYSRGISYGSNFVLEESPVVGKLQEEFRMGGLLM